MRLIVSNDPFEIEDMHIPYPIVVFESNTVCLVKIESIHGYQGVGISKGGLCIFHAMKDSAPNTKREIINMWWKEINTVSILGESMTVHHRTHQHGTQIRSCSVKLNCTYLLDNTEAIGIEEQG